MVVKHNLTAMNSNRMLGLTTTSQAKSTEKLSSGYKINRAADDAAGLSISEKMRKQIRGLTQASSNAQDGISMVQTADGALEEVHAMLQRCNELAIKASNGTLSEDDRKYIADEIDQIHTEIDRVRTTSKFNETYLFPESGTVLTSAGGGLKASDSYFAGITYDVKNGIMSVTTSYSENTASVTSPGGVTSDATILEERIANEFVPNAIAQILDKFPALKTSDRIDISLDISKRAPGADPPGGSGGVLAFAGIKVSYVSATGDIVSKEFSLWVDPEDFNDEDALGNGSAAAMLEGTLAHELMHTAMQNTFPYEFTTTGGSHDAADFPGWFKEGMADISGGGFTAGHNHNLKNAVLAGGGDAVVNGKITAILSGGDSITKPGSMSNYEKGYLASAYIGLKAGDGTLAGIPAGINNLFNAIKGGQTLNDALTALTGKSISDIETMLDTGTDPDLLKLAKDLVLAAGADGAGSFIAGGLNVGGTQLLGNNAGQQLYRIAGTYRQVMETSEAYKQAVGSLSLHVGADSSLDNKIEVKLFNIGVTALGLGAVDFSSKEGATAAIDAYADAITKVSSIRSYFGAVQNRLEHTIANLDNVVENTTSAESQIRDTDMATEMVRYSNNNILAQAGQAMLAQANQTNQGILSLLS